MLRFGSAKLVNCLRGERDKGEELLVDWPPDASKLKFPSKLQRESQRPELDPTSNCVISTMSIRSQERDALLAKLLQAHGVQSPRTGRPSRTSRQQMVVSPCA